MSDLFYKGIYITKMCFIIQIPTIIVSVYKIYLEQVFNHLFLYEQDIYVYKGQR